MGKRYATGVLMKTVVLLRSGMTRKCHVPFWRAVEKVTSSLTLIIMNEGLRLLGHEHPISLSPECKTEPVLAQVQQLIG